MTKPRQTPDGERQAFFDKLLKRIRWWYKSDHCVTKPDVDSQSVIAELCELMSWLERRQKKLGDHWSCYIEWERRKDALIARHKGGRKIKEQFDLGNP